MLQLKVLVLKLGTINGFAAGAIALGEITTLNHELLNDTVKEGAFEVQRLSQLAETFLPGAEGSEIVGCLGHDIVKEFECDTTDRLAADGDVKKNSATSALGFAGACHGFDM